MATPSVEIVRISLKNIKDVGEVINSNIKKFPYYLAGGIRAQLLKSKIDLLENDQDRLYIVSGREGSGKSTLAFQMAYAVDDEFSIDDVVFDSQSFARRIRKIKKGKAVVFDEAFNGLSSRGALSKENRKLVRLLMECRQRNLFIFIVLPSFFLLEKYVALFRSHALFHTYKGKKHPDRHYYKVYNYNKKRLLFILGAKLLSYGRPKINTSYRFYGKYPPTIDREAYVTKKLNAFRDNENFDESENKYLTQRNSIVWGLKEKLDYPMKDLVHLLKAWDVKLGRDAITNICNKINLKREERQENTAK